MLSFKDLKIKVLSFFEIGKSQTGRSNVTVSQGQDQHKLLVSKEHHPHLHPCSTSLYRPLTLNSYVIQTSPCLDCYPCKMGRSCLLSRDAETKFEIIKVNW